MTEGKIFTGSWSPYAYTAECRFCQRPIDHCVFVFDQPQSSMDRDRRAFMLAHPSCLTSFRRGLMAAFQGEIV